MLRWRRRRLHRARRRGLWAAACGVGRQVRRAAVGVGLLTAAATMIGVANTPVMRPAAPTVVNDVTQLNPVPVAGVVTPTTVEEVVAAVRGTTGPISVGGGRYSMGGQTATRGGLQIDMRRMNQVLRLDTAGRTVTVQAGIRWHDLQRQIDPANLAIKIMQTYGNFTVGGSLSVNVHGRYIGLGPLVLSVRSIAVVLADGSLVRASPTENAEIFYGAIGGYGGLGVIVEATLALAENVRVRRTNQVMPVAQYGEWFKQNVRDDSAVIFHNADLYPDRYESVNAVSYSQTADSLTVTKRLIPSNQRYGTNRAVFWAISEWRLGKWLRQHVIDPYLFRDNPVSWRNHEASYDVAELEPRSRAQSTYVLQEYFVPVERLDAFVPKMGEVLRRHRVNVINVSIRHARPDPGTMLAWARREVFAFVLYYKQDTDEPARREVGRWTRELIDLAVAHGGAYYLPYQPWATEEQFLAAYPRAPEFFALKQRLDPANRFRNTLWDRYYLPRIDSTERPLSPRVEALLDATPGYRRDEGQTFLTHPEWYIVYSSEEYAEWLRTRLPTRFPYLASIGQYWVNYREVRALTKHRYAPNPGYHVMLNVIGVSYSVELAVKALYENTVGRLTGWLSAGRLTDEDRFAAAVHADYGRFIHDYPWYRYRFAPRVAELWRAVPVWGRDPIRKLERRLFLTVEFGVKAIYAALIEWGTAAAYAPEAERIRAVAVGWADSLGSSAIRRDTVLDQVHVLVSSPRYDRFRDAVTELGRRGAPVRLTEIAGNDEILLTGIAPRTWHFGMGTGRVEYALPLPTDSTRVRVAIRVPSRELIAVLGQLDREGTCRIDHVYDY